MTVSIGNGVSTGNIITAETNPVTGGIVFSDAAGNNMLPRALATAGNSFVKRGHRQPISRVRTYPTVINVGGIVTWQWQEEVLGDFDAVEVLFDNVADAGYTLRAAVSVSQALTSTLYPVQSGASVTSSAAWTDVTLGGSTALVLPAKAGVNQPSVTVSDKIYLSSLVRTDFPASEKRIIMLRIVTPAADVSSAGGTTGAACAALEARTGLATRARYFYGDFIANYPGFSPASDIGATPFGQSFSLRLHYRKRTPISLMCVGDSTFSTVGGTVTFCDFAVESLVAAGRLCTPHHSGWPGNTSARNLTRAIALAGAAKPTIAVYQPYSVNDPGAGTSAAVAPSLQNATKFISYCIDNDVYPVISTPFPNGAVGAANPAWEETIRTEILKLGSFGVSILDISRIVGNPVTGAWIAENRGDGFHPTDAGRRAIAAVLASLVNELAP